MDRNQRIQRIERFFARVGTACTIFGATLLLLLAGHYALGGVDAFKDWLQGKVTDRHDMYVSHKLPAYADMPQAREFWIEHLQAWDKHFEPYIHYRRDAFEGKWTNVNDMGMRLTVKSPNPDAKKVFMFGGSTLWGSGATDAQTIASQLQKLLGPDYDVYNFGESGFVSAQELNYLLLRLAEGDRPDIVIFYDGANDAYTGAYSPAVPRDPHGLREEWGARKNKPAWPMQLLLGSNYWTLVQRLSDGLGLSEVSWDKQIAGKIDDNAGQVVRYYQAHIQQVQALGKDYGFQPYFFWQPVLFAGEKPLLPYEQDILDGSSETWVQAIRAVYSRAKPVLSGREAEGVFEISDVFAGHEKPLYWDWCHVEGDGNRIVAERMAELAFRVSLVADQAAEIVKESNNSGSTSGDLSASSE